MLMLERRLTPKQAGPILNPTVLPHDFLRLVEQTVTESLRKPAQFTFSANGGLYLDEIVLSLTLAMDKNPLSSNTVFASVNFNPTLETPSLEELLGICLDAANSVFEFYLHADDENTRLDFLSGTLSALEEAPFEWTLVEKSKFPVWVKLDKSNPMLETEAEKWLRENDPEFQDKEVHTAAFENAESQNFFEERLDNLKQKRGNNGPLH